MHQGLGNNRALSVINKKSQIHICEGRILIFQGLTLWPPWRNTNRGSIICCNCFNCLSCRTVHSFILLLTNRLKKKSTPINIKKRQGNSQKANFEAWSNLDCVFSRLTIFSLSTHNSTRRSRCIHRKTGILYHKTVPCFPWMRSFIFLSHTQVWCPPNAVLQLNNISPSVVFNPV